MKKIMFAMFVLCAATTMTATGCIENGDPLPTDDDDVDSPDAGTTEEDPDACPTDDPDASTPPLPTVNVTADPTTITAGGSTTVSWTSTNADDGCWSLGPNGQHVTQPTSGSFAHSPTTNTNYKIYCSGDGGEAYDEVTVTVNPATLTCESASDCSDGLSWTDDACDSVTDSCVHWPIDCGGMQVKPASNAATCQFWGGFGTAEPAPLLGTYAPSSLTTGPAGGDWKAAPQHACSVICYNPGLDETTVDIQIEWNGLTFLHQQLNGLHKGTWDGQHTR